MVKARSIFPSRAKVVSKSSTHFICRFGEQKPSSWNFLLIYSFGTGHFHIFTLGPLQMEQNGQFKGEKSI
jgi:hypothetical protein